MHFQAVPCCEVALNHLQFQVMLGRTSLHWSFVTSSFTGPCGNRAMPPSEESMVTKGDSSTCPVGLCRYMIGRNWVDIGYCILFWHDQEVFLLSFLCIFYTLSTGQGSWVMTVDQSLTQLLLKNCVGLRVTRVANMLQSCLTEKGLLDGQPFAIELGSLHQTTAPRFWGWNEPRKCANLPFHRHKEIAPAHGWDGPGR